MVDVLVQCFLFVQEVCKRTESHDMSSSRAGHQVSRANQQEIGSKLARSPDSGSIQAEPDPLADWFSVHFQNLTENGKLLCNFAYVVAVP